METPETPARRAVLRWGEALLSGPAIGAVWVLAATAWAFSGGDDDRVLGVRASPIIDLAKRHFSADVRALTTALVATSIALGAAIGIAAELAVALRRAHRGGLDGFVTRTFARVILVASFHAALLAWGIARMPQLYADVLYLRNGRGAALTRTLQVLITDVLGPAGVLAVVAIALVAWTVPRDVLSRVRRHVVPIAGSAIVLVLALLASRLGARPHPRRAGAPNIVILAVDSLRDDRLATRVAPRLSALSSEGVRFSRAYVTIPRTLPSWTTILTGREPHNHGLRTMFPRYEDRARDLAALPQRLSPLGYKSGVVGDYAADIFTRVRYGFDRVDAPTFNFHALIATRALERATPLLPLLHSRVGRGLMPAMREMNQAADPSLVARDAVRMLDRLDDGKSPFMMTVFFSTAHFPYAAPAPYYRKFTDPSYRGRFRYHKPNVLGQDGALDDADVREVRALYDGAVASIDDAAGQILDELKRRNLDDDTILVVTADHGEMLYDDAPLAMRGQGHGDHLFGDQVTHVPLAMKLPSRLGAAVGRIAPDLVRDVDLTPTLLDLVGAPEGARADLDGRTLRPLLVGGEIPARPVFAETEVWMTESIAELPTGGPSPLRIPYPNVAQLTELDPRLGYDIVLRAEVEPTVIAAKHRMVLSGSMKLVYVPTRHGARWFLFDRAKDPSELFDLSLSRRDDFERLRSELWRWMSADKSMEERDGMLVPRASGGAAGGAMAALRLQ